MRRAGPETDASTAPFFTVFPSRTLGANATPTRRNARRATSIPQTTRSCFARKTPDRGAFGTIAEVMSRNAPSSRSACFTMSMGVKSLTTKPPERQRLDRRQRHRPGQPLKDPLRIGDGRGRPPRSRGGHDQEGEEDRPVDGEDDDGEREEGEEQQLSLEHRSWRWVFFAAGRGPPPSASTPQKGADGPSAWVLSPGSWVLFLGSLTFENGFHRLSHIRGALHARD